MAFENLTERLQNVFKNLRKKGKITESDIQEATKEIRLALLEADVALPVVKDFIKKVRERAIGHEVIDTLNPAQQIIKIVNEELTEVLGSDTAEIIKSPKIPTIIMMVGLQGAGKTTFAGKLANKLKKEEDARPLMIAADIYRPAAIDQLKTLGQQIDVPVFALGTEVPAVEIVRQGLEQAKANHNDYVLIDTAGRLQIDELLMNELRDVKALAQPNEILLEGIAEATKNAVIAEAGLLDQIRKHNYEYVIERCISIKKSLVEADERETSLRQLLNFGHTIGHGIEKLSSYTVTHGQAVAKGMIAEARGAYALGLTPNDISGELTEILKEFGFDTSLDYNANDIYKLALKDKKIRDGQINIIVPDSIGKCTLRKLSLPELNELITLGLKQE